MALQGDDELVLLTKGERLASGSVFTFGSIIAARLATVLNSIIIIRTLGPSDYGVLAIIVLTMAVAGLFAALQMPAALVTFLAATPRSRAMEANRLLGAGFLMTAVSTAITAAVLIILTPVLALSLYSDSRLQWLILLALLGLVMTSLCSPMFSTFQAFEKIRELGLRNAIAAILTIPSTFLFVVTLGLQGAVLASVVNGGIAILVNVSLLRKIWRGRSLKLEIPRERSIYVKLLGFTLPALGGAIVVTPVFWFLNTWLAINSSFADLGQYSAGYGLSNYVMFIPSAVGVPLVPIISRLTRGERSELSGFIVGTIRVAAFLTLIPTIILTALPEPFLRLLYGSAYAGAGSVVRFISPAIFLASITSIIGYGMAGTNQMKSAMLMNVVWAVPAIVVSVIAVPLWQGDGLALAILCAYTTQLVAGLIFIRHAWSVNLGNLAVTISIAAVTIPIAVLMSLYVGWAKLFLAILLVVAASIAGIRNMTPREVEVLSSPFRKLFSRIIPRR